MAQYIAQFDMIGLSDLMFGTHVAEEKKTNETHVQFEERTWKQKVLVRPDGQVFINRFALTNGLEVAGKFLGKKIPSGRGATYTDRLRKGTQTVDDLLLFNKDGSPLTIDDIKPVPLFVPSDGKRGSGKRVHRIFPTVDGWKVLKARLYVFDGKIDEETLVEHLVALGKFVGFGSMRVENGGVNGRWSPKNATFEPYGDEDGVLA